MPATVLITGAAGGIGRATALTLAQPGRHLLLHARDTARAASVADAVGAAGANAEVIAADLSTIRGAVSLAEAAAKKTDDLIVIHSAGVARRQRTLTADGIEMTFAVQYLARYILNWHLLDKLWHGLRGVLSIAGGGTTRGTLDPTNLQGERKYSALGAIRTTSIANDLHGLQLNAAMSSYMLDQKSAGRSWVYGPGLVHGTQFDRDLPLMTRLAGPIIGRIAGVDATIAATRVTDLATSQLAGGLYHGRLAGNDHADRHPDTEQSRRLDTISRDLVRTVLPDWRHKHHSA